VLALTIEHDMVGLRHRDLLPAAQLLTATSAAPM
jgi:hypothetical protein